MMGNQSKPVAIIGGGPVGLAAAAHLVKRKKPFILFEKSENIAGSVLEWGHVQMFSPWEFTIDEAAAALLQDNGWEAPPVKELPTGRELVDMYLRPLSELPQLKPYILTDSKVVAINRKDMDKMKSVGREEAPFEVTFETGGVSKHVETSAVIDATGTWNNPNPIGARGNKAINEDLYAPHINYGIPDLNQRNHCHQYAGKTIAVIGSGHSAIHSLLALEKIKLSDAQTKMYWILRKQDVSDTFGGGTGDALPARGALGLKVKSLVEEGRVHVATPFRINQLEKIREKMKISGMKNGEPFFIDGIDEIIVNTGSRPDFSFLRELRYHVDPALESVPELAELIDPNVHSCGTVRPHGEAQLRQPEKGLYIVGSKSYGRAPTFLMATGYEQVRSVVAALSGDWEAARKVALHLPETGVCHTGEVGTGCCVTADKQPKTPSCC